MKILFQHLADGYFHLFVFGYHISIVDRQKNPLVLFSKRNREKRFWKYGLTVTKLKG